MESPLMAALASPVSARTGKMNANTQATPGKLPNTGDKENRRRPRNVDASNSAKTGGAASSMTAAPCFTVPESPSQCHTPGRMENLRVLIEEAKKAAAEGRLAAALRKYETAMVTLPEAYKPRLRQKIARLEAQLDAEEDRSPATPGHDSRSYGDGGYSCCDKDPGPVDLLQIAVQDLAAAADIPGRNTGALSTFSPRRSSPLVRGLTASSRVVSSERKATGHVPAVYDQKDEEEGEEQGGTGDTGSDDCEGPPIEPSLSSLSLTRRSDSSGRVGESGGGASAATDGRAPSSNASEGSEVQHGEGVLRGSTPCRRVQESYGREALTWRVVGSSGSGGGGGGDVHFGLGAARVAEGGGGDGEGEEEESPDKQERLRVMNKELSDKLEKQVVTIMNEASSEELTGLHGIGLRRAQLILQTRRHTPFKTLADLSRIGMYPKQIEKMGKHNMLECLDVYPA